MSYQNAAANGDFNVGNCQGQGGPSQTRVKSKYLKPFFSFVVSILLALSMSHLCEKYSTSNSFENVKSDLGTLRNNLNLLMNEVKILIESRDELKIKLLEVGCMLPKLSEAISQLKTEISEGIDTHSKRLIQSAGCIKDMVKTELKIFNEDHTGKMDFALELLGGSILTIRDTQTYDAEAAVVKIFGVLPMCFQQNTPRAIIQPTTLPGECWAIAGSEGSAVIQLLGFVKVSGFTLEHISPTMSPTGETSTAPKDFSVWGLEDVDDNNGFLFGNYTYDNTGAQLQYFKVKNESSKSYEIVELKIHSNNGNDKYTCVYRFRVHGTLISKIQGRS